MACDRIFPLISIFFSIILLVESEYPKRNITITYNDGCNIPACKGENGTFYNLIHFTALGHSDAIHYVWSSIGAPSVLVARTSTKAKLMVNWEKVVKMQEKVVSFEPATEVHSLSAIVIARLIEFDDPKDKADITKASPKRMMTVNVSSLMWSNVSIEASNSSATFRSTTPAMANGSLSLMVQTLGVEGRSSILPHLQHLPNTTEFSLILDNLEQHYNHSRFAVELLVIRNESAPQPSGITLEKRKSIDDEYTPAVFNTYEMLLSRTSDYQKGNFLQWKPVVYTSADRKTDNSQPSKIYSLNSTSHYIPEYSIAHAYFGNFTGLDMGSLNISFGISKDQFYNATKYYVWSSSVGYGDPPTAGLSILVISIISAGLGIPLVLIIVGGVYVACQKRRAKRATITKYSSINA